MPHLLCVVLGLVLTAPPVAAKPVGSTRVNISGELNQFDLRITEQHVLVLSETWQHPARTYYRSPLAGRFPWTQDLADFAVHVDGKPQPADVVRYGQDKVLLRLPALAAGERRLEIQYTVKDIRGFPEATLPQIQFWDVPLRIEQVTVKLSGLPQDAVVHLADRYDAELLAQKLDDGSLVLNFAPDQSAPPSPVVNVRSSGLEYREGLGGLLRHFRLNSPLLPVAVLILVLMLLLRLAPARVVLAFVSIYMFVPLAFWLSRVPGWTGYFAARKDIDPRATYVENFYGEVAVDVAVALILLLLAWRVVRGIWRGDVAAYHLPYEGLVSFLVLLLFVTQDPQALLMFPLAAFFPVLYSGTQVTRFFGADAHLWVERVIASGKVSFEELSRASGLAVSRLNRIFAALPTHPVAVDHQAQQYLSADVLAALERTQFCNNCGGALKVEHTDLLQCPYCGSDYAVALQKNARPENVPPLMVTSLAAFSHAFGVILLIAFGVLAVFGAVTELYAALHRPDGTNGGDWAVVLVIAVMGGLVYAAFAAVADGLASGKGYTPVLLVLAMLSPFIWPLVAVQSLRSPRSRFFFGRLKVAVIQTWLAEKKFLTLAAFSQRLGSSELDAMNLAHHLTASGALDAVYDRRTNTLTERALFRHNAAENSCQACGGVVSVVRGARVCRYCGATPDSPDP